ncbi:MAG: hypothetical protein CML81_00075 [Rhodobiaceae bacterium]|nr:hypothetical protein [Rhodobiaceae bacterium]RPF98074.1 MAG: hypothetical protein CBD87_000070 [Rhizobiales bacterium TMED227]|tara:strand:+ start:285 stop:680 length:396 start_codon:yes stop_codon:yes gene_type:complete
MASILRVNTLTDASSNNSTAMSTINQGTAKAWVNLNGTGTIATRDSFNVSSLSDTATGEHEVTLSSAFSDTNYATSNASAGGSPLTSSNYNRVMESVGSATNKLDCITYAPNNGSIVDISHIQIIAHGDLA